MRRGPVLARRASALRSQPAYLPRATILAVRDSPAPWIRAKYTPGATCAPSLQRMFHSTVVTPAGAAPSQGMATRRPVRRQLRAFNRIRLAVKFLSFE